MYKRQELARSGYLDRTGIRLLACKPETIDRAEDRELFKETMEKLHQPIIPSEVVENLQDALCLLYTSDEAAYNECVNMKEAIAHACSLL